MKILILMSNKKKKKPDDNDIKIKKHFKNIPNINKIEKLYIKS
jgi:hypothetical protein